MCNKSMNVFRSRFSEFVSMFSFIDIYVKFSTSLRYLLPRAQCATANVFDTLFEKTLEVIIIVNVCSTSICHLFMKHLKRI